MTSDPTGPTVHELKVVPPYFDALVSGAKTFEVRKNDRAYQRGDVLKLREWHTYVGGVGHCDGIEPGTVVLALKKVSKP